MNEEITKAGSVDQMVAEFGVKFKAGIAAISEAARIYADALIAYPDEAPNAFREKYAGVTDRTWDMLRRIGNGDMAPETMLMPPSVANRIGRLTIQEQTTLFGMDTVEVVSRSGKVTAVSPKDLTTHQASVLVDEKKGCLRTKDEQLVIMNALHGPQTKDHLRMCRIVGKTAIINGVEFGIMELERILRKLKGAGRIAEVVL